MKMIIQGVTKTIGVPGLFIRSLTSLVSVSITLVACGSTATMPAAVSGSSSSRVVSSPASSEAGSGQRHQQGSATGVVDKGGYGLDEPHRSTDQATCGVHKHSFRSTGHPAIPASFRLKQMVVICRHGDRAPVANNLGNIHDDGEESVSFWLSKLPHEDELGRWNEAFSPRVLGDSCGQTLEEIVSTTPPWGQLTVRGAEELRLLGENIREHLVGGDQALFPDGPEAETSSIYVRTTAVRRTQQSAQSLLLGLGLSGGVDLFVRPRVRETLWPMKNNRRRQDELIERASQENVWPDHAELKSMTSEMVGVPEEEIKWTTVREIFTCYEAHGVPLSPDVINSGVVQAVSEYAAWLWGTWFRGREMGRLGIGSFLAELLTLIGARGEEAGIPEANIATTPKLAIFSGHDNTLVPILCALKIYDDAWPPYASYIALDVADGGDGHNLVRMVFNDKEVVLPGASGAWIPLADLQERLEDVMPRPEDSINSDFEVSESSISSKSSSEISAAVSGTKD